MANNVHTTAEVQHDGGHHGVFPPFDPTTFASQILWLAITFGLFYVLMAKVALPRIGGILETRHEKIGRDLDEANRLKADSDAAAAAYEKSLADARRNAQTIASETRSALAASIDSKRAAAEAGLGARIAEAEGRIAEIKAKALAEVDGIAVDTTEALVSALIGGSVGRDEIVAAVQSAK